MNIQWQFNEQFNGNSMINQWQFTEQFNGNSAIQWQFNKHSMAIQWTFNGNSMNSSMAIQQFNGNSMNSSMAIQWSFNGNSAIQWQFNGNSINLPGNTGTEPQSVVRNCWKQDYFSQIGYSCRISSPSSPNKHDIRDVVKASVNRTRYISYPFAIFINISLELGVLEPAQKATIRWSFTLKYHWLDDFQQLQEIEEELSSVDEVDEVMAFQIRVTQGLWRFGPLFYFVTSIIQQSTELLFLVFWDSNERNIKWKCSNIDQGTRNQFGHKMKKLFDPTIKVRHTIEVPCFCTALVINTKKTINCFLVAADFYSHDVGNCIKYW